METQKIEAPPKVKKSFVRGDEFLTTAELMALLKVRHKQTIYKLIGEGMPKILVGRHYRFLKSDVIDFLKRRGSNVSPISK